MGTMAPPAINGMDELLALVRDDSAIAGYLKTMQEYNNSIVLNLNSYNHHSDIDMRERAAKQSMDQAATATADVLKLKAKVDKSISSRRKSLNNLEASVWEAEKALDAKQKLLDADLEKHDKDLALFEKRQKSMSDFAAKKQKTLNAAVYSFKTEEANFRAKIATLKKLFG